MAPAVGERLSEARARIESAGGDAGSVTIVAVTKTFGPEAVLAAVSSGIGDIGENYAGELIGKASAIDSLPAGSVAAPLRWHFLGSIQRNKVARLAPLVSCWQSVSRAAEAEAIARRSDPAGSVFVEVNVAREPNRAGCDPDDVPALVEAARACGLAVRGLMAVAPLKGHALSTEQAFDEVASLAADLGLRELSLGMSADLEQAVRAGSTMVRLGTALFGTRKAHAGG